MDSVLAITAFQATFGLLLIFGVIFPGLAGALIAFALIETAGEHEANREYENRDKV
jgi:hypothetical protein